MRRIFFLTSLLASSAVLSTPAAAWTPEGRRCVTSVGYTPADWEAYKVPQPQADKVRACLARVKAMYDKKRGQ